MLQPSPTGLTTLVPREFIVFVRPLYGNKYWATADGKFEFSEPSILLLAQTLSRKHAKKLYGLPMQEAPKDSCDLNDEELHTLLEALSL